ncbi:MAG: prolipoprotein diacylglyceryl transferase [Candidatus Woesearchaeota archaeon]
MVSFYISPTIPGTPIHYYGVVYALGFLLMYWVLKKNASRLGLNKDQCSNLVFFGGIGLIVGARIVHFLFSDPLIFFTQPLEVLAIHRGGMAFLGGVIGLFLGAWWYAKRIGASVLRVGDILVLPGLIVLAFGRIANFINQELVGTITTKAQTPWCVNFVESVQPLVFEQACRHPYQLYASVSHFFLALIILILIFKTSWLNKPGMRVGVFIFGYSVLRFITDFFREESIRWLGLSSWQFMSIIGFGVGLWLLWYFLRKVTESDNSLTNNNFNNKSSKQKKLSKRQKKRKKRV